MRIRLSDTAREAFQFLVVAVGLVTVLRLGYWAIDRSLMHSATDELGQCVAPFRNGFLIRDPHLLVTDRTPLIVRLAMALLLSLIPCAIGVFIALMIGKLRKKNASKWAVNSGRVGLVVGLFYFTFHALAAPERSIEVSSSGMRLNERHVRGLVLKGTVEEVQWSSIRNIQLDSSASSMPPPRCGWTFSLNTVIDGGRTIELATITPEGDDCVSAVQHAHQRLARLKSVLDSMRTKAN